MNALGTHHQDMMTPMTDTLPADSAHATVPTRPTTIIKIRPHASVHLHISLALAHLALTTPHSIRHTVVTGTILHLRETYAPPPPLIPNSIPLQLHPTQPQWSHPYLSPALLHQLSPLIHRSLQTNLPRLHPLSALRKQLHDSPQPHIWTLSQPSSARNYP